MEFNTWTKELMTFAKQHNVGFVINARTEDCLEKTQDDETLMAELIDFNGVMYVYQMNFEYGYSVVAITISGESATARLKIQKDFMHKLEQATPAMRFTSKGFTHV